jgi:hypothetical protein
MMVATAAMYQMTMMGPEMARSECCGASMVRIMEPRWMDLGCNQECHLGLRDGLHNRRGSIYAGLMGQRQAQPKTPMVVDISIGC